MVMGTATEVIASAGPADWFFANATFAAQLAEVPTESEFLLSSGELVQATLSEPTATALLQMITERLAYPEGHSVTLKGNIVSYFNASPREDRRALRAIAGSLWAKERLAKEHPRYDRSIDLLGFPGRGGEHVDKLLRESNVRDKFALESMLAEEASKEALEFAGPRDWNPWHAWQRWRGRQSVKEGLFLEFQGLPHEGSFSKARDYFPDNRVAGDRVMLAVLRNKLGILHAVNGDVFEAHGYPHRAAEALFKAAIICIDESRRQSEFFYRASRLLSQAIEKREKEEVNPGLWNSYFHSTAEGMMALYRSWVDSLEENEQALAFAEAQEAYGLRLVGSAMFLHEHRAPQFNDNFYFWLGAQHLFEAASVYALLDSKPDRAEKTLAAALHAMHTAAEIEQKNVGGIRGRYLGM